MSDHADKLDTEGFLARMTAKATKAKEQSPAPASVPQKEKIGANLDFWPETVAAMPTELTRVSLFRLVRRGRRKLMEDVKLESRADIEVLYTGKDLDQADADLWLACLRMGRGVPMGERLYTDRASMLREIGRADSGQNRKWLEESLIRMGKASFQATFKRNGRTIKVMTGMLKWGIEEESGAMFVRLDPDGAQLFENLAYVDWNTRLALSSNAAKAIQLYACGHQDGKPHRVLLADLAAWCGYEGRLRQFRKESVIPALRELESQGVFVKGTAKLLSGTRGEVVTWTRAKAGTEPTPLPPPDPGL
jgi:hypothetical protein